MDDLFGPTQDDVVHNLFFGLIPDAETCDLMEAASTVLGEQHASQGRWLKPHRYHMTLHYLGSFAPLRQDVADAACRAAATVRSNAFELQLDCSGSFPGGRVGWLGCKQQAPGLAQLWDGFRAALARGGVRIEGSQGFTPHVTILRDARAPLPASAIPPIRWSVTEFVLIDSQHGRRNVFAPLGRWALR